MLPFWSKSSTTTSTTASTSVSETIIAPDTMDVTTPTNERPGPVLEEQDGLMPDLPVPSLVASDESSPELPPIVSPGLEDKPFDLNADPRLPECWGHRGASANFRE